MSFAAMKIVYLFLFFCILGCSNIEYSPNQVFDNNSFKNINANNLKRLGDGLGDDTVRFIVTGDTQRSYNETVKFYKKVNSMREIDFVIVAGDVTEFGTLKEMQWLARELNLSFSNEIEFSLPDTWAGIGIDKIGLYTEFNTNDFYIVNFFQNVSSLRLSDVFQLGIGIRVKF